MSMNIWKPGVGDKVTWTSTSAGYTRTKTGVIEQVVRSGDLPDRTRFVALYRGPGVGMPRDHESYVVRVPGKTEKSQGKLYWPRANQLKSADEGDLGGRD